MSAFLESGRSDRQKLGEIKVRFRPEADLVDLVEARRYGNLSGISSNRDTYHFIFFDAQSRSLASLLPFL